MTNRHGMTLQNFLLFLVGGFFPHDSMPVVTHYFLCYLFLGYILAAAILSLTFFLDTFLGPKCSYQLLLLTILLLLLLLPSALMPSIRWLCASMH
jgi:hypothetical protein